MKLVRYETSRNKITYKYECRFILKLQCDFYRDWAGILKKILVNEWGYSDLDVAAEEAVKLYFNVEKRKLVAAPRKIHLSREFVCPAQNKQGWAVLKSYVEDGKDLTYHLSKTLKSPSYKDDMLLDWGIHHFHLGSCRSDSPPYWDRTDPVLFARVTQSDFYVIGCFNHGDWAKDEVFEILHNNWSKTIDKYRLRGVDGLTREIDEAGRKLLRKANVAIPTLTKDGTAYMSPGGGQMSSGDSFEAMRFAFRMQRLFFSLEEWLGNNLDLIESAMKERGGKPPSILNAKLVIKRDRYFALFPAVKLLLELPVAEAWG